MTNRAERRNKAKVGMTAKALKDFELESAYKAIDYTVRQYSIVMAMTCHDKLGFGPVRAQRFMAQVKELFDSVNKGYVSLEDLAQTLEEETGIVVK